MCVPRALAPRALPTTWEVCRECITDRLAQRIRSTPMFAPVPAPLTRRAVIAVNGTLQLCAPFAMMPTGSAQSVIRNWRPGT
jgi:hypothetical protein